LDLALFCNRKNMELVCEGWERRHKCDKWSLSS
jgi:hypothetical protein